MSRHLMAELHSGTSSRVDARAKQVEIFRKMTPAQRLAAARDLYWTARSLKAAGLRQQHPHWSEEEIQAEAKRIFMYARS